MNLNDIIISKNSAACKAFRAHARIFFRRKQKAAGNARRLHYAMDILLFLGGIFFDRPDNGDGKEQYAEHDDESGRRGLGEEVLVVHPI